MHVQSCNLIWSPTALIDDDDDEGDKIVGSGEVPLTYIEGKRKWVKLQLVLHVRV